MVYMLVADTTGQSITEDATVRHIGKTWTYQSSNLKYLN